MKKVNPQKGTRWIGWYRGHNPTRFLDDLDGLAWLLERRYGFIDTGAGI